MHTWKNNPLSSTRPASGFFGEEGEYSGDSAGSSGEWSTTNLSFQPASFGTGSGAVSAIVAHQNAWTGTWHNPPTGQTASPGRLPVSQLPPDRVFASLTLFDELENWIVDHPYKAGVAIFVGVFTVGVGVGAGVGAATGTLVTGSGTLATGVLIAGPFGATTVQKLTELAEDSGPTIRVITQLTQSPEAGRGLSVATGPGADALANAARVGGTFFQADIPRALLVELQRTGLAVESTTFMNGVTATEIRFLPQVTQYIVKLFSPVGGQ